MVDAAPAFWDSPSIEEWWRLVFVLAGIGALIGAGEGIRILLRWPPEFTRKLVHVSVGVLVFFAPQIFTVPLPAVVLAVVFIIVNLLAIRFGLLKGMHGTGRPTFGTVYYPLAFLILVLIFWYRQPLIISLSILVLALGDAGAAIVGELKRAPATFSLSGDRKSLEGSMTMFLVSFAVLFLGLTQLDPGFGGHYDYILAAAGIAAATATAWEALSSRGLDNLSIPLSVAFVLWYFLIPDSRTDVQQFTMGSAFAIAVAVVSYQFKFLSASGAVATYLLATVVFGIGGWKWTIPILVFFVLSSILSRIGRNRKAEAEEFFEKSGPRDWAQVFANGGAAGIFVVCSFVEPDVPWYPLYLGSLAAVTADTWGTEIGLLSGRKPLLITSFKPVAAGSSGGVTLPGSAGGLGGSLLIGVSALPWLPDARILPWIVLAGLAGSLFDSFLGATVQGIYRCPVCGKSTERKRHCNNQPTVRRMGIEGINNDAVNWGCALMGAGVIAVSGFG
ncbi:MAG: DUF92 domain-containing protein [Ignavibacteriales bacterium]|nr:DUF92 domain-containing protein [Ignavibacteriales bacterium]